MEENIVERWLKREGVTLKESSNRVDKHLYTYDEINPIASRYAICSEYNVENVSIADIYGFAIDGQMIFQGVAKDVVDEVSILFSDDGNEYNTRSNSLLDVPRDELISVLGESFIKDPIRIDEIEKGKCVVNGNGKHRYILLRCLYLDELSKIDENDKYAIQTLKDKYKIPASVRKVDLRKTYIKMFIMTFGFDKVRAVRFDSTRFSKEGTEIEHMGEGAFSNGVSVLSDAELVEYISELIRNNQDIINEKNMFYKIGDKKHNSKVNNTVFIKKLPQYFRELQSFRSFVVNNLSEVFLEDLIKRRTGIDINDCEEINQNRSVSELNKNSKPKCDPRD